MPLLLASVQLPLLLGLSVNTVQRIQSKAVSVQSIAAEL
jgi:hypothetical protein